MQKTHCASCSYAHRNRPWNGPYLKTGSLISSRLSSMLMSLAIKFWIDTERNVSVLVPVARWCNKSASVRQIIWIFQIQDSCFGRTTKKGRSCLCFSTSESRYQGEGNVKPQVQKFTEKWWKIDFMLWSIRCPSCIVFLKWDNVCRWDKWSIM